MPSLLSKEIIKLIKYPGLELKEAFRQLYVMGFKREEIINAIDKLINEGIIEKRFTRKKAGRAHAYLVFTSWGKSKQSKGKNMAKKERAGITNKKLNDLVLDIAWDQDYAGLNFTTGWKLESSFKAANIGKKYQQEAFKLLISKGIIKKGEAYDPEDDSEIETKADEMVEETRLASTPYGKWLAGLREYAFMEGPGHWMPVPLNLIATFSKENNYTEENNKEFIKQAKKDKFLKTIKGEAGLLVADDIIYKALHRSRVFKATRE